jgi:hypothetical protein
MGFGGGAVLDNDGTSQYCQMGRVRLARRRGIREEPVTESPSIYAVPTPSLAGMGRVALRTRATRSRVGRGTPGLGDVAGREATVKDCGVAVAKVLGHNWVPIPSKGFVANVGTVLVLPGARRSQRRTFRLGAWPADRAGTGRRTRSSPRTGKPSAWRRGPA